MMNDCGRNEGNVRMR